jgi:hypothetical protein
MVEAVPMPDDVAAWVREFAEAHFSPEPFRKRQRDRPAAIEEPKFGKVPIFDRSAAHGREPGHE